MPNTVGPGSVQQSIIAPTPTLDGAGEYEYVTILNPLPDDFQVQVAQDIPVNMPFQMRSPTSMTQTERDVVAQYGLQLKNPEHQAKKYIFNTTIIPAGKTMNFKGNEAQVVVRQLINEMMQRQGQKRLLSDPTMRKQIEDQIIIRRGSVQDLLDERLVTPREQIDGALNQSNEVTHEETPFAGLNQKASGTDSGTVAPASPAEDSKKPVAQAKK